MKDRKNKNPHGKRWALAARGRLAALLAALLLFTLTACTGAANDPGSQAAPSPAAQTQEPAAWALDPATITDDFVCQTVIGLPELVLSETGFAFESPQDLTSQQLYLLFLACAAPEELEACKQDAADAYVFSTETICQTLDRYLQGYAFDITQCQLYDAAQDAVVTPMASGFGGKIDVTLLDSTYDGNTAVFTADVAGLGKKAYTVTFYDGGFRYVSVCLA